MNEKAFVKQLEGVFKTEGFFSRKEVGVGYGVADLVLIRKEKVDRKRCQKRLDYRQLTPLMKDGYFKVLKHIPDCEGGNSPISIEKLIERTHFSKAFLKYEILKSLEKRNYIKQEGENFYFKINGWLPITNEIIAIEAKMKDWKRGFTQANRYKLFADRVYLAVPKEIAHLVDRDLLRHHEVGLISFDAATNKKKMLIPSKKKAPGNEFKRSQVFEFFWGREILKDLSLV